MDETPCASIDTRERCARCGGGFHCGAAGPAPCRCTAIRLDAATLARLRGRYQGCLCLRCLAAIAEDRALA